MRLVRTFGVNMRARRKALGLSQEALAHTVGLAITYVGQLERGQRNPTLEVVERIAEVLECDAVALLGSRAEEPGA